MLALLSAPVTAASYSLVETWQGKNFLDYFNFHVGTDPTNGYVNYLDKSSAESAGLVKLTDSGSVYLGVDHATKLDPNGKGRDSVRIGSKKYYDQSLVIADIAHMPGSVCGTWPAFWSVVTNATERSVCRPLWIFFASMCVCKVSSEASDAGKPSGSRESAARIWMASGSLCIRGL